ncbi:hypothetical protein SELMODRAFT_431805 [Selaginella moellendorffii]|uniref:Uncharacterized protein n=1 Tax=Selaginella moellendorffii TaxID=88036 RepID=D8TDV3_SELML|nr:hypothetical protein SELMODRAFT_431805 [Selaginella moellendorffii]
MPYYDGSSSIGILLVVICSNIGKHIGNKIEVIANSDTVPKYDALILEKDDKHDLQKLKAVIASNHTVASSVPKYDPPPLSVLEDDNHDSQELEAVMVGTMDSVWYTSLGGKILAIDNDDNLRCEDI